MGGTKRTAEEQDEDFDPDFDFGVIPEKEPEPAPAVVTTSGSGKPLVIKTGKPGPIGPAGVSSVAAAPEKLPSPINDLRNEGLFEKFKQSTNSLISVITKAGLHKEEVYSSRESNQVAAVYKFLTESGCIKITADIDMHKGTIISIKTSGSKMSGAKEVIPEDIELICVAAAMHGRLEKDDEHFGLFHDSFEILSAFAIDDDGKLRMRYAIKWPDAGRTHHLDTYVTILDPDLIL